MNENIIILNTIYKNLLDREPDKWAIETYMPILENNLDKGKIFVQEEIKKSTEYSTNISFMLRPDPTFEQEYHFLVQKGREFLKNQKIAFVGLARNLEATIEKSIKKLSEVGKSAKDYRIVIFENDSEDNTRAILHDLEQNNTNICLILEDNNRPHFGPVKDIERTEALAEYRNKLNEYVRQNLTEYDFVIVTDLDFIDFSTTGVYNSFGWLERFRNEIGGIAGNSYEYKYVTLDTTKSLWNYDSWAFRSSWWAELPDLPSMTYYRMLWFGFWIMPVGLPIMPVNSAFGGMAIYKKEYFVKGVYDGYDCEHVCFHAHLKKNISNFQLMLNPSQIMLL